MDIIANIFGMLAGIILPAEQSVDFAIKYGNHIPGPGDPDPTMGGGAGKGYKGNPADAWGQSPNLKTTPAPTPTP